jgi:Protein of unknown function (DUF2800).
VANKKKGHSARAHAQWSASSTERNWLCPGNIALIRDVMTPPESKAAAWGTACHELTEKVLKGDTVETGEVFETERHVFYVDQEMLEVSRVYTDYIKARLNEGYFVYAVEQNFSLDSLGLGMEAGGTSDTVLYNPTIEDLEVVDLKTGKGHVVEAKGNPQERFYGLGALLQMDLDPTPVATVTTTIVQPRAQHRDGIIRSETLPLAALMDWVIDLDQKIRTAATALKLYQQARDNTVAMDAWVDTYLNPGETQCTFCPAAGACPALRRNAMAISGAWQDDSGIHFKSNQFAQNSVEGVEADLDMLETLEAWIRERRALAHEMAAQGYQFDHHTLVEKIGNRRYTLPDSEMPKAIRAIIPISDEQLFDKKLKSPAGLERSIGKGTVRDFLADLIHRPVTGTDLIRSSQTTRETVPSLVDRFFVEPMEVSDGTGE